VWSGCCAIGIRAAAKRWVGQRWRVPGAVGPGCLAVIVLTSSLLRVDELRVVRSELGYVPGDRGLNTHVAICGTRTLTGPHTYDMAECGASARLRLSGRRLAVVVADDSEAVVAEFDHHGRPDRAHRLAARAGRFHLHVLARGWVWRTATLPKWFPIVTIALASSAFSIRSRRSLSRCSRCGSSPPRSSLPGCSSRRRRQEFHPACAWRGHRARSTSRGLPVVPRIRQCTMAGRIPSGGRRISLSPRTGPSTVVTLSVGTGVPGFWVRLS
jgi:hypothetical protein